ncbi:Uncharacterised protein [Burkholderia pseudomallei]|nr:Uncharacterised protein [Burkholderia pseudomallei]
MSGACGADAPKNSQPPGNRIATNTHAAPPHHATPNVSSDFRRAFVRRSPAMRPPTIRSSAISWLMHWTSTVFMPSSAKICIATRLLNV